MICVCEICGKQFKRKPSHVDRVVHQVCSRACQTTLKERLAQTRLEEVVGQNLEQWLYQHYVVERMTTREISLILYGNINCSPNVLRYLHKFNIPTRTGGEAIKVQWENADDRRSANRERAKVTICSEESRAKLRLTMQSAEYRKRASELKVGNKNPMWDETMSEEDRSRLYNERHSSKENAFRKQVLARDKNTCMKCGGTHNLQAHHLMSFRDNPQFRFDISNGVTLCELCHKSFHKRFGYGLNTKEQFEVFTE